MTLTIFLDWWRNQLAELLPESLRRSLRGRQTEIMVALDGDEAKLTSHFSESDTTLSLASDAELMASPALKAFLAGLPDTPRRIRLSLAPGEFLVRQFNLPIAARPHLAETVRYQLTQHTPFNPEQCWFACGANEGSSTQEVLATWLLVIRRHKLSRLFDAAGLSAPSSPWPCSAMPPPDQPLELAWQTVDEKAPVRKRLRIAWAATVVFWMVALTLHVNHKFEVYDHLAETAGTLRIQALEVGRHRDQLAEIHAQAEWLAEKKQTSLSTLAMLDLLTQRLDDQTWLQRFELNDQRLTLTGVASSPASLIGELEALPMLHEVRFETAITRDAGNTGNRFKLSAKLMPKQKEGGA